MVNKPKPQTLKERIEKNVISDLDQDWQPHFTEVIKSLGSIEHMPEFNLLNPQSAQLAAQIFSTKLDELHQIKKQITAVNSLLNQKRDEAIVAVNELPWPILEKDLEKKN